MPRCWRHTRRAMRARSGRRTGYGRGGEASSTPFRSCGGPRLARLQRSGGGCRRGLWTTSRMARVYDRCGSGGELLGDEGFDPPSVAQVVEDEPVEVFVPVEDLDLAA